MSGDARRLLAVQALRAFAYGLGSVLIGVALARAGRSGAQVGLVLGALLAGTALTSLLLARFGDRVGRRRSYRLLLGAMGASLAQPERLVPPMPVGSKPAPVAVTTQMTPPPSAAVTPESTTATTIPLPV